MSITTQNTDSGSSGTVGDVLGPSWLGPALHKDGSTPSALTLFGGSEYLSVGHMTGDRGNTLTVYMDRWGGSAANYIVAPEMVFIWPDDWGNSAAGTLQQPFTQPSSDSGIPCANGCPGLVPNTPSTAVSICLVNCGRGPQIEVEAVPEPATTWLVGACVVTLLLFRWSRQLSTWRQRRT